MEGEIKMKKYQYKPFLPMRLQFFAEGDPVDPVDPVDPAEPKGPENKQTELKYTDEDVNQIIDKKFAKWQKEQDAKILEAEKLSGMNADEKEAHEKQKLLDVIKEYEAKENLQKMSKEAESMLLEKGITSNDDILAFVVTEDAETTSTNVKAFVKLIENEREQIKEEFEKRLGSKVPLDGTGSTKISRGAQMAKRENEKKVKPAVNPWG